MEEGRSGVREPLSQLTHSRKLKLNLDIGFKKGHICMRNIDFDPSRYNLLFYIGAKTETSGKVHVSLMPVHSHSYTHMHTLIHCGIKSFPAHTHTHTPPLQEFEWFSAGTKLGLLH